MVRLDNDLASKYGFVIKDPPLTPAYDALKNTLSNIQLSIVANRVNNPNISKEELLSLLFNTLNLYKDLDKLKDVYKAARLLAKHINSDSIIGLVTDYDADGIDSAVVLSKSMLDVFKVPAERVVTIVNKRVNGNGFNKDLVNTIIQVKEKGKGLDIVISADHGSSSEAAFKILKQHNIDLLITDHHQIPVDNYPISADVLVNNQRTDSTYSKEVSGCCVAFLVMLATFEELYGKQATEEFNAIIPYVAISTITDVMSLRHPFNRHIVMTGVNEINSYRNKAWVGVNSVLGLGNKVTYKDIGFKIGPLINTGNRLSCEELAFEMLMANEPNSAFKLASKMAEMNDFRKAVTKDLSKVALREVGDYEYDNTIVCLIDTDIDVKGIIATKVGISVGRPCACFIKHAKGYSGSTRGIVNGVNVHKALTCIKEEYPGIIAQSDDGQYMFGGHEGAAGVSIYPDKLEDFKLAFDNTIKEQLVKLNDSDGIHVDAIVKNTQLNPGLAMILDVCGPYGKDWPKPVLLTTFKLERIITMGSVCKISFRCDNDEIVEGMHFFNKADKYTSTNIKDYLKPGNDVIVAFNLDVEKYNGVYSVAMAITDIEKIGAEDGGS